MLASEVMDQALVYLNDMSQTLYTYTVQIPYLRTASENLEKELATVGIQIQRAESSVITVTAGNTTLTPPSDFFLPIELKERNVGENENQWTPMDEKVVLPLREPINYIEYWAFISNQVKVMECTVDKEIHMRYIRTLTAITAQSSLIDTPATKNYLSARTAELCARYIGMNESHANSIASREVEPARDALIRDYVLNGQGNRGRRLPFRSKRLGVY